MASRVETRSDAQADVNGRTARIQRRHTIAAMVYFIYGVFYLYGAQYITGAGMSQRGMSTGATMWFVIGGAIAIVFPLLIHRMFAFGLSLGWSKQRQRITFYISFTLILGLLVVGRVYSLIQLGFYAKSALHIMGLLIASINAVVLLWAGLSRPCWLSRQPEGGD